MKRIDWIVRLERIPSADDKRGIVVSVTIGLYTMYKTSHMGSKSR